MKHLIAFLHGILFLLVFSVQVFGTTCTGPFNLNTQSDVNALAAMGCDTITGNLTIQGSVTDLSPLNGIKVITGNLDINDADMLVSISFKSLTTVGGFFQITASDALISFSGFKSLTTVSDFIITGNMALTSFSGFESLTTVVLGIFNISTNGALRSIPEFNSLKSVGGSFSISNNHELISITGFKSLTSVGAGSDDFQIFGNGSLTTISGFKSLTTVNGFFIISFNTELTSISGFSKLHYITFKFEIQNNSNLTYCCGLYNILANGTIGGSLDFTGSGCDKASILMDCDLSGCAPNCQNVTVSIDKDGLAFVSIADLVTNSETCEESGRLNVKLLNQYNGPVSSTHLLGGPEQLHIEACQYLRTGIKALVSGRGGDCWSQITFHHPQGPIIEGQKYHLYCLDPAVSSVEEFLDQVANHEHLYPHHPPQHDGKYNEYKTAHIPCEGVVHADFVADWVTPFPCTGEQDQDTIAKIIYREWEAYDKYGNRGVGYDTICVYRITDLNSSDYRSCPESDTLYCGQTSEDFGPFILLPRLDLLTGTRGGIGICDTVFLVHPDDVDGDGILEFYPWADFDPKCGVEINIKWWEFDSHCDNNYKVAVSLKQTCTGDRPPGEECDTNNDNFEKIGDGYFECEFWVTDLDTARPIVECKLDHFQDQSIIAGQKFGINGNGGYAYQEDPFHCFYTILNRPEITYEEDNVHLECQYKEIIVVPTGTHECAAHVTIPPVCAWDEWSGIKQVKARVFAFQDVHGSVAIGEVNGNVISVMFGPPKPVLDDLSGDADNKSQIRAENLRRVKDWYNVYRWNYSDYLDDILPSESIATVLLEDNEEDCTIVGAIWDPDEGDYGDCVDVEGDCYSEDKTIKLPHTPYPYVIVYEGVDYCHNKYYELCYILVKDHTKPIAVADKGVTVSLTDKKAWVDAEHFDEGSWDNCDINLMLARRTDWWTACVDLDYDTCWRGHHDDVIYEYILDEDKKEAPVEAHYAKVLEWLCYDDIPCGLTVYNAWKYDLLKKATQYHDPTITDEYFRKIFDIALVNQGECVDYTINYPQEDCGDDGHWEPLWQKFKQEPPHPGLGCDQILITTIDAALQSNFEQNGYVELDEELKPLVDNWEQLGGGWSDQVPFSCEDACKGVVVELLVMDYWCNWGKVWTSVWVEDRTPISIENEVEDVEITCNTYKNEKIYDDPSGGIHPVSLEAIVSMAQGGVEDAYDALDEILGGYCKVWRDPYGNWVDADGEKVETDIDFVDYTCTCTTEAVRTRIYDEHLGYIWKLDTISDCYYYEDEEVFQKGIVVVNCAENVQCEQDIWSEFDHCGQGVIYRKFKIYQGCENDPYNHKVDTIYRVQTIWIGNECPDDYYDGGPEPEHGYFHYFFEWPYDTIVETCGLEYDDAGNVAGMLSPEYLGEAVYTFDDDCRIVGIGYEDEVYRVVGGDEGCYKIVRHWYGQDWCGGKPVDKYWWRNREAITTYHEQKILVIDTEAPNCTITGPVQEGGEITAADCYYNFEATVEVVDACGLLTYYWELKNITDPSNIIVESSKGPIEIDGVTETSFDVEVEDLGTGSYKLQARIQDDCQNESYCEYHFTILAGKKPQVVCVTSTTAELNPMDPDQDGTVDTGMVLVWAEEVVSSYIPACNDTAVYKYIELIEDGVTPTFDGDELPWIELGCTHIGPQTVVVWVESKPSGTTDYCEVLVVVQDNMEACGVVSPAVSISGLITTELGSPVEQVQVVLNFGADQKLGYETSTDGTYHFVGRDGRMEIEPTKDINDLNGVSTLDMVKIQKHILGIGELGSKYRERAADANGDGKVSPIDLLELRRLILGYTDAFPLVDSWRFFNVETDKETYVLEGMSGQVQINWIGVKIGDVNMDNDPSRRAERTNKSLVFHIEDEELITGSRYKVTLQTSNFTDITGYQYTLQADPGAVKILGVEFSEGLGMREDNFNLNGTAQGVITTSWNAAEGITLPAGEDVFTVVLEAQKNISLSEALTVNSAVTTAEAYNSADQLHDVSLSFGGTATVEAGFALYQNEPNPFKESTVIGFSLPESMHANLTVYDVTGKVLKAIEGDFVKGYNQVSMDQKEVLVRGVLYYQLDTEEFTATRKMVAIK